MDCNFPNFFDCLKMIELPSHEYIFSLANQASEILENEITDYREKASNGAAGSLLCLNKEIPSIIVPDLHARPDFLNNILNFTLPEDFCRDGNEPDLKLSVKEALDKKLINVICVGDAIHTELTLSRWQKIQKEFDEGLYYGYFMQKEMLECLSVLCSIMNLKIAYAENFHFLKGNHENILNENSGGDFAFCKYADEGEMVKLFISSYYGDDVLYLISCWEKALPLVAAGKNFVVSHAEPLKAYTRQDLIDARLKDEIVNGLIWTKNDQVTDSTVEKIMKELLQSDVVDEGIYFGGHRPVFEKYSLRQNGKFLQLHNPKEQNIALVYADRVFDPEKHIVGVSHE